VNELSAEEFVGPLLNPWLGGASLPEPLLRVFDWTYYGGGEGRGRWPGPALSAGKTLRENRPVDTGWAGFVKFVEDDQKAQLSGLERVREGRLAAGAYLNAERDFQRAAMAPRSNSGWSDELGQRLATLAERQQALDAIISKASAANTFGADGFMLASGYATLVEATRQRGTVATKPLMAVLVQQRRAAEKAETSSGPESEFTLFRDVRRRLGEVNQTLAGMTDRTFSASEQAELPTLDAAVVGKSIEPGVRLHTYRFQVYRDAVALGGPPSGESAPMIGRLVAALGQIGTKQDALKQRIDKYDGGGREGFQSAARQLLNSSADAGGDRIVDAYIAEIERELGTQVGYPLTRTGRDLTMDQMKAIVALAAKVRTDLAGTGLSASAKNRLETATRRLMRIGDFASALVPGANGAARTFRLILPKESDQKVAAGSAAPTAVFAGRNYRTVRIGSKVLKPIWEKGDASPWISGAMSEPLPALEFFEAPDPKTQPDARHSFSSGNWAILRALEGGAERRRDGRQWDLHVPLRDAQGDSRLQLTVELDEALPPLDQWPR
jgi:hypothetical protein